VKSYAAWRERLPIMSASSLECYEAVRTGSYCAIVAEFPLPGCSPDELLEEVQRVDSSLPVLIFDAQGGFSDVVRLTKAGAQHFFGAGLTRTNSRGRSMRSGDCEVCPIDAGLAKIPGWQ
jgi:hypothetical protein